MAKYTTEQIKKQFEKIHGDRYDYSLVDYVHSQKKIKIICKKHGVFEQLVGAHRRGQHCSECFYETTRHSAKKVIELFKLCHGDRYDYSLVEYVNADTKVKIICKEHGIFEQVPEKHIRGNGCPKCIGRNKTQSEIINEFKKKHGDRYDYSLVKYKYALKKVKIICKEHGIFEQTPQAHISGKSCIKCSGTYQYTTSEIIDKFQKKHGNRYDYSLVTYLNKHTKVKIICKKHGIFEQNAHSHMTGSGCPSCSNNYSPNLKEIIDQFQKKHGDRYDYSLIKEYLNAFTKLKIICSDHGVFEQTSHVHKRGSGCPQCAVTIGHTKDSYINYCNTFDGYSYLYVIECFSDEEHFYKVGIARLGAISRFNSKSKLPYKYEVNLEVRGLADQVWDLEKRIHRILKNYKYIPFESFHGKTECFSLLSKKAFELIEQFKST